MTARRPTLDDVRRWPATVTVEQSAAALGVSRAHAYELITRGEYPVRTVRVGYRIVVVTASLLAVMDGEPARAAG